MNIRHITAFIPLICLAGCASTNSQKVIPPDQRAIIAQISESEFPLPASTPYDGDPKRQKQYQQGYRDGVRERLDHMGEKEWSHQVSPPADEEERPYFDGFKDGMSAKPKDK